MEKNSVLNTNPSKYIIAGLLVIILFFGGLGVWSVYFPFQGAVIAPGVVNVLGERKMVQHLEGGIINKIFVKEGDEVTQGDVLIELKSSQVSSNVELLQGRLWAKEAEAARLRAEAGMKPSISWPNALNELKGDPDVVQILSTEKDIFVSRRSDLQGKIKLYQSQISQTKNRIEGAKEELKSVTEIILNLEEDLAGKRPLLAEKYMGKNDILTLERSLSEYRGRKGKLKQDIAQFTQMIQEHKLRIVDMENQYRDAAVSKLGEVTDLIFDLKDQITPILDAQHRLEVRAPVSGVVLNMQVHSEDSGVIQPGMPLLEIVPKDLRMVIKAQVRPQDIISVKKGQPTKVQLAAFQRKSTPPIRGEVIYVSPDLMSERTARGAISYYEVHVQIDEADLKAHNAYLSPGMPAACYITTESRTVISYLLDPLLENVDKAMRE
ncbi:HlyD family type I secretion periplasmic adaptor subunit [uncultured Desulfobacter sp.]|uniref:HlyD family type I secretion periplasmic adaptor subunit n=1 Tax=uncultured Desulfobacter sp. TaxID=240139 RepID=UPI0029C84279|nr:HlyD family type I secretion periplasmic adaptor subunit [uncultured Desulfobacter sp.]